MAGTDGALMSSAMEESTVRALALARFANALVPGGELDAEWMCDLSPEAMQAWIDVWGALKGLTGVHVEALQ